MKFVAILGTFSENSYLNKLIEFTKFFFIDEISIEILDISKIPMFNRDFELNFYPKVKKLSNSIENSDGVFISSEYCNGAITPNLKSILEWLSYEIHPFKNKPVYIFTIENDDFSSHVIESQLSNILKAKGLETFVMPGNFRIINPEIAFDIDGMIVDEQIKDYLEHSILKFIKYSNHMKNFNLNVVSNYSITKDSGGYKDLDEFDATSGATDY